MSPKGTLLDRLEIVISEHGGPRALTLKAGLPRNYLTGTLSRMRAGKQKDVSSTKLAQIASAAEVSLAWLQRGEGPRGLPADPDKDDPIVARAEITRRLRGMVSEDAIAYVRHTNPRNAHALTPFDWLERLVAAERLFRDRSGDPPGPSNPGRRPSQGWPGLKM
jgi:hypothetical protein